MICDRLWEIASYLLHKHMSDTREIDDIVLASGICSRLCTHMMSLL